MPPHQITTLSRAFWISLSTWWAGNFFEGGFGVSYHQVQVHPQDVPKTAVIAPLGLYEFLWIPFSLKGDADFSVSDGFSAARFAICVCFLG